MEVFPNPTFLLLQIFPFAGVLIVLKFVLLDPLLKHMLEREEMTSGTLDAVAGLQSETEAARSTYETRTTELRNESAAIRMALLEKGSSQETVILEGARSEAEASLEAFRTQMAAERLKVAADLRSKSSALAIAISSSVLGRTVQAGAKPTSTPTDGGAA